MHVMSGTAVAFILIGACIVGIGIIIQVHLHQRDQGRLPGQRWNETRKRWEDIE